MYIFSGDGGWQVRVVDIEEKGRQNRSLWDAVLEASKPAPFTVSVGKGETAIANYLQPSPMPLPSISITRTMYLSGSNRSSLQVRPRCHTVLLAAVRSTNTAAAFFLAEKLSSMSCVSRVTWSTVDFPCRMSACFRGCNESMIGSTRA